MPLGLLVSTFVCSISVDYNPFRPIYDFLHCWLPGVSSDLYVTLRLCKKVGSRSSQDLSSPAFCCVYRTKTCNANSNIFIGNDELFIKTH